VKPEANDFEIERLKFRLIEQKRLLAGNLTSSLFFASVAGVFTLAKSAG